MIARKDPTWLRLRDGRLATTYRRLELQLERGPLAVRFHAVGRYRELAALLPLQLSDAAAKRIALAIVDEVLA